jgi:hypothetical protein
MSEKTTSARLSGSSSRPRWGAISLAFPGLMYVLRCFSRTGHVVRTTGEPRPPGGAAFRFPQQHRGFFDDLVLHRQLANDPLEIIGRLPLSHWLSAFYFGLRLSKTRLETFSWKSLRQRICCERDTPNFWQVASRVVSR